MTLEEQIKKKGYEAIGFAQEKELSKVIKFWKGRYNDVFAIRADMIRGTLDRMPEIGGIIAEVYFIYAKDYKEVQEAK